MPADMRPPIIMLAERHGVAVETLRRTPTRTRGLRVTAYAYGIDCRGCTGDVYGREAARPVSAACNYDPDLSEYENHARTARKLLSKLRDSGAAAPGHYRGVMLEAGRYVWIPEG